MLFLQVKFFSELIPVMSIMFWIFLLVKLVFFIHFIDCYVFLLLSFLTFGFVLKYLFLQCFVTFLYFFKVFFEYFFLLINSDYVGPINFIFLRFFLSLTNLAFFYFLVEFTNLAFLYFFINAHSFFEAILYFIVNSIFLMIFFSFHFSCFGFIGLHRTHLPHINHKIIHPLVFPKAQAYNKTCDKILIRSYHKSIINTGLYLFSRHSIPPFPYLLLAILSCCLISFFLCKDSNTILLQVSHQVEVNSKIYDKTLFHSSHKSVVNVD